MFLLERSDQLLLIFISDIKELTEKCIIELIFSKGRSTFISIHLEFLYLGL